MLVRYPTQSDRRHPIDRPVLKEFRAAQKQSRHRVLGLPRPPEVALLIGCRPVTSEIMSRCHTPTSGTNKLLEVGRLPIQTTASGHIAAGDGRGASTVCCVIPSRS